MKITNKQGLPDVLVNAITNDPYTRGDGVYRSITELINPPQIAYLKRKYDDKLTMDIADRMYALYGRLIHQVLEDSGESVADMITEQRLFTDIFHRRISGSFDSFTYSNKTLNDYKFVSVYKMNNGVPKEYTQQLNCYAYLLSEAGTDVENLTVTTMYRDWSASRAGNKNYPDSIAQVHPVELWTRAQQKDYLEHRVYAHKSYNEELWSLNSCSPEERWERGATRQTRKQVRCESYCEVASVCPQYKVILETKYGE